MSHLVHWDDVEPSERRAGEVGGLLWDLGRAAGSVGVGLRRTRLEPGRRTTPPHAHGAEEEIFYILAGSGLLWQDGEVCELSAGDCAVHLPMDAAHTIRAGEHGIDVLAFGTRIKAETAYHPRSTRLAASGILVEALGPGNLWQLDETCGPLHFAAPGPRPANVVATADVAPDEGGEGDCAWVNRDLGRAAGSVATGLRHETAPEGKLGCPPHCHGAEEEIFVVLDGAGTCLLGEDELPVRRGHVLARPPGTGVAHAFRGGRGGVTYLAYGTREPNDVCYYPRSNKIAFWGVGVIGRIERLDYWDGERPATADLR